MHERPWSFLYNSVLITDNMYIRYECSIFYSSDCPPICLDAMLQDGGTQKRSYYLDRYDPYSTVSA